MLAKQIGRPRTVAPNDIVLKFVIDRCQRASHFGVTHKTLRSAFVEWCNDYGRRPLNEPTFAESLIAIGCVERIGSTRRWEGLRLI